MNATGQLHAIGQSLWLDNITRGMLDDGTLARYIDTLWVTGLTSNPTIFDHAIRNGTAYDDAIGRAAGDASDEAVARGHRYRGARDDPSERGGACVHRILAGPA